MTTLTGKQLHDLFYDPHSPFKDDNWHIEDDNIADKLWDITDKWQLKDTTIYSVNDWGYIIWDSPHACSLPKESYSFEDAYAIFLQRPKEGMTFQDALLYAIAHPGVAIKPKYGDTLWRVYGPDDDTFFFEDEMTEPCFFPPAATIDKLWITNEKKED